MSMGWTAKWLQFSKIGHVIDGLFLPLKVPLRSSLNGSMKEKDRFSWDDVFRKHSNIGLVIDLTKTAKYYAPESITSQDLQYAKIWMEGHGSLPPQSQVDEFCDLVDAFLAKNSSRGRIIAVHCTHGLNRTGYMVCKYLILRRNIPPLRAIQMFESCRGEQMERQAYVADLQTTRAHDLPAPARDRTEFRRLGDRSPRPQVVSSRREADGRRRQTSQPTGSSDRYDRQASTGSIRVPDRDLRTRLVDRRGSRRASPAPVRHGSSHSHSSSSRPVRSPAHRQNKRRWQ